MPDAKSQHLTGVQQIAELSRMRQNAAAWLLGISVRRLRDHAAPRNTDGTYNGALLVRWREKMEKERLDIADGDPLMVGGDGKDMWLSEYRKEKAREAHRKNEVAEGELVETGIITMQLLQMSHTFRQRAEAIERDHGPDVGAAIRDMVDEAQQSCQRIFPQLIEQGSERGRLNGKAQMSIQIPNPKPKKEPVKPVKSKKSKPKTTRDSKGRFVKSKPKIKPQVNTDKHRKKPKKKPAKKSRSPMRKRGEKKKPAAKPAPQPVKNKPKRAERRTAPRRGIIRTRY